jgi:hypothetical protein
MPVLRIDSTWPQQIAAIRDANTEDTNLIRFDNAFFRVCRAAPSRISVDLVTATLPMASIKLSINTRDFYIETIDGRSFGRYASTIDKLGVDIGTLDNAVRALPKLNGTKLFETQSLIVFCVAESIRSDMIATRIGQAIAASSGQLLGTKSLNIGSLLPQARAWGQSSDAVWAAISPRARQISTQARSSLSPADRQFSERINENNLDAALVQFVRGVKVLKWPNN